MSDIYTVPSDINKHSSLKLPSTLLPPHGPILPTVRTANLCKVKILKIYGYFDAVVFRRCAKHRAVDAAGIVDL
jgi:hypothetical protein